MKSKAYYFLLFLGAKLTVLSFFKPLNLFVAKIYSWLVPYLLHPIPVFTRHSSKDKVGFNIFLSDLDLSVVLNKNEITNHKKYLSKILKFKKFLPFLGEVEIYEEDEYARLQELIQANATAHKTIRNFRKILWMQQEARHSKTPYHCFKALRSARITAHKINVPPIDYFELSPYIPSLVSKVLPLTTSQKNIHADSVFPEEGIEIDFFQARFFEGKTDGQKSFVLDVTNTLILSAITPQTDFKNPVWNFQVAQIRQNNLEVRLLWLAFSEIEYLTLKAVERGSPMFLPWIQEAIFQARQNLENSDPACHTNDHKPF